MQGISSREALRESGEWKAGGVHFDVSAVYVKVGEWDEVND